MDKIQLLPDSVANQIAAGEVIQRPASVIKELMENSVDAGATRIDVFVVEAGRTSIQVIDNGMGMSITDARLAFERHATSKIRKAEDLFSLHTMGFRGEALPSIAAVAQVTLQTRQASDNIGTCLNISGSRVLSQEPVSCPSGTNFLIENLFFNVPVRRRFLKSNHTELQNIVTAFQRIALVYPGVAFTLHSNGQELYNLPIGNLHQRIVDVFGKKLNQQLLPLHVETSIAKIDGFVGKPEAARKKTAQQMFFVNGRYMNHAYFMKAVMSAYERLIPQGDKIPFFIYFSVPAEDIDVNIHPTKTEIKFQDEASTWQTLSAAVRDAVGKFNNIPKIDFDTEGKPDIPVFNDMDDIIAPKININPTYNPFNTSSEKSSNHGGGRSSNGRGGSIASSRLAVQDWEKLYEDLDRNDGESAANAEPLQTSLFGETPLDEFDGIIKSTELDAASQPQSNNQAGNSADYDKSDLLNIELDGCYMQYKGAYIMTTIPQGILLADQSRAHERILFERYMKQMDKEVTASQKQLFPQTVQFSIDEMVCLPTILPELQKMGFELENQGGGTYAINAIPASLADTNYPALLQDMVTSAADKPTSVREELYATLAASMARNAAIPHGQYLSGKEMEKIMQELMQCENTAYTPNGQKIYSIVTHQDLVGGM